MHIPARCTVAVFAGPSLYGVDTSSILAADYRPPARMGDIYRVLGTDVETIALIDGVFHAQRSVWHREILAAIEAGIRVVGASSMGALRAIELAPFGMEGFGTVFGWYRAGIIDRDDEVALSHGDADSDYRPFSEPLVNIRATTHELCERGHLSMVEAHALIEHAARQHYSERSLAGMLDCTTCQDWPPSRREHLDVQLRSARRNIKREDAIALLSHLASPTRQLVSFASPSSIAARPYRRTMLSYRTIGGTRGDALLSLLDGRPPVLAPLRQKIIQSWLLETWARDAGLSCPEDIIAAHRKSWERGQGIPDVRGWLRRQGLLLAELESHIRREALCAWLLEVGPQRFGISSYIADWAICRGLLPSSGNPLQLQERIVDLEPAALGYPCDVSVELLQFLQCTDQLSLLIERRS